MQFNSIGFLFCFLPLFLILYYCAKEKLQTPILIIGSLLFYGLSAGDQYWWVVLLVVITGASYFVQRRLEKPKATGVFVLWIVLLSGILIFLKVYAGGKYLPAGVSFYLFQIAAVLADVYRGKVSSYESASVFFRDIAMFPKLLSGPLMDPGALRSLPEKVQPVSRNIHDGLQTLILGLSLKVVLANNLGGLWAQPAVTGYEYISTPAAWIAIISFAMQLYLDFYGYSLMAIGIGKMLGFDLPANFLEPYAARSVSDFYRRWHATLGAWFKQYVYIPLGGNRKSLLRTLLNIAVVWLFTGLWHGVGGNYLLWAGFLCLLIINERLWLGKLLEKSKVFSHFYVVAVILLSWIPFAIGDWNSMVLFIGRLFGQMGTPLDPADYLQWLDMYRWLLLGSLFAMTPLPGMLWKKIKHTLWADLIVFVLFWAVVYFLATTAQNPFLYFQY